MEISSFLERIGYYGSIEPTFETLKGLQSAFLLSVPFENLDMLFEDKTELSFNAFYEKVVLHGRGGNSYECNGVFYSMLKEMGFDVDLLSARMVIDEELTPEFDHMLLRVSLDSDYLVDVSNVQFCPEPILLGFDQAIEYSSERCTFRLGSHVEQQALFFKTPTMDWQPRLIFSVELRALVDFATMFRFHQTSDKSILRQGQLVTMMTEKGRITLSGMTLFCIDNERAEADRIEQHELANQDEYLECLKHHFGIEFEG